MLYAIICTDKAHATNLRQETRTAHLEFIKNLGPRVKAAGPFLADDMTTSTGTLLIVECANRDEALAISQEDPYSSAGLFESVEIRPWNWLINNPET
ncbi:MULTISPECIES: YciI family protein [Pseudovibrio]|uniref:YciI family protein n=1 Tax=Stappiaceae TaxID=2821832 RepID=UPI00236709E6|nr:MULTISPECIES: YciI family protein [Pseudovibrio]MDD7911738.1 YciI family protein [Pseudovibrio exalbescens]MDX5594812.1 YciI family protein [Pseudovibrio sp. SPO723]